MLTAYENLAATAALRCEGERLQKKNPENKDNDSSILPSARTGFTVAFSIVLFLMLTCLIVLVWCTVWLVEWSTEKAVERLALVQSMQVGMTLIIGFLAIIIGFLLVWHRISEEINIRGDGKSGGGQGTLQMVTNSPGIVFLVFGSLLIGGALFKPLHLEQTGGWSRQDVAQGEAGTTQPPLPVHDDAVPEPP